MPTAEELVVHARLRDELSRPLRGVRAEVASTAAEVRTLGRVSASSAGLGGVGRLDNATRGLGARLGGLHTGLLRVSSTLTGAVATGLRRAATGFGLLTAGVGFFGLKAAAGFQQAQVSFGALLGSVEKGNALFAQLRQYANVTPFETKDVAASAQTLLRYGLDANKVLDVVKKLGDAAATTMDPAGNMAALSLALGQTLSAGAVRGDDARQLQAAGVNVYGFFQKKLGLTRAEVLKLGEAGKLSGQDLVDGILAGDRALGIISGSADKLGKTLGGRLSTLKDTLSIGLGEAAKPAVDALSNLIGTSDKPGILMTGIADLVNTVGPPLFSLIGNIVTLAAKAMPVVGPVLVALATGVGRLLDAASPAFAALSPVVDDLVGAIGGFVTAIVPVMPDLVRLFVTFVGLLPDLIRLLTAFVPLIDPLVNVLDALLHFAPVRGILVGVLAALMGYKAISGLVGGVWKMVTALQGLAVAQADVAATSGAGGALPAAGGGMGTAGKIGAGVSGVVGLGLEAHGITQAVQHGATVSNVLESAGGGALLGGAIGSVIPGVGTAIGAGVGGVIGGGAAILGGMFGSNKTSAGGTKTAASVDASTHVGSIVVDARGLTADQAAAVAVKAVDRHTRDKAERGARGARG